ncbi:hypothetical protein TRAPUB_14106 [Trametes pubescens]|uniref:Uncharacterized protein n=1 Tax=Trametes pubescens TaxID=154538 RepID=A0A1M2VD73_TRAPU|nr:hypothetical protein TRAPUB_3582 [Trametes pubescens]OJT09420.1 hypothetical protein TRAPUB_14106 [Trametes pubescens]
MIRVAKPILEWADIAAAAAKLGATKDFATNGLQKRMRYAPRCYASEIVVKCGRKIVGWPLNIPFTDVSNIDGGSAPLAELCRLWNLPDGDPNKLRFEPASHEDRVNAARDPESIHPTPHFLPALKVKAADRDTQAAARAAAAAHADAYHPLNMEFVGRPLASMTEAQRSQRRDTGGRRGRASDSDPRVRRRRPMRGIMSMPFVLPGSDGVDSSGERAGKRRRVDEYPLEDRITQFKLSFQFGGKLTCSDTIKSGSGWAGEDEVD